MPKGDDFDWEQLAIDIEEALELLDITDTQKISTLLDAIAEVLEDDEEEDN